MPDLFTPMVTSGKITGRGIAARAQTGTTDVTAISVYFPPFFWKKALYARYRQCCRELAAWLSDVLCECCATTVPLIFADVNDGMGLRRLSGSTHAIENGVVSEGASRIEKMWEVLGSCSGQ